MNCGPRPSLHSFPKSWLTPYITPLTSYSTPPLISAATTSHPFYAATQSAHGPAPSRCHSHIHAASHSITRLPLIRFPLNQLTPYPYMDSLIRRLPLLHIRPFLNFLPSLPQSPPLMPPILTYVLPSLPYLREVDPLGHLVGVFLEKLEFWRRKLIVPFL
jgi:hypothetical protein